MDDRAVSVALGSVLHLAIGAMLLAGLVLGVTGLVEDQREAAVRSELEVVGQRLAADLTAADRLAAAGGEFRIETTLPERVAGATYEVTVAESGGAGTLTLRATDPSVTVTVSFRAEAGVVDATVTGGDLTVTNAPGGELEVSS